LPMKEKIQFVLKLVAIGFIALILLIPLQMIKGLIGERQSFRQEAMDEVAKSWARAQTLSGPVLVIPCEQRTEVKQWDDKKRVETTLTKISHFKRYLTPEIFFATADLTTEERYKGIYSFPVYRSQAQLEGTFRIGGIEDIFESEDMSFPEPPYLIVGINDTRGIRSVPSMEWGDRKFEFQPGFPDNDLPSGIHVTLPELTREDVGSTVSFRFALDLQGMHSFMVTPLGKDATVRFKSNWPHPSFAGPFPTNRSEIRDDGFEADWTLSHFATNLGHIQSPTNISGQSIGIQFFNPVDVYMVTERSLKYGFLFIGLTFVIFFLYEILKSLRIHPVEYGLVGIALALFFLLLLSLTEHIAFGWAYLVSAVACIGLLAFYVSHIMKSVARGGTFALITGFIYTALYCILQLQDYALLTGSLLLFIVLGAIMFLTRNIDWHQLTQPKSEANKPAPGPPSLPPK
jgi:inner membrane protein